MKFRFNPQDAVKEGTIQIRTPY